MKLRTQFVSNSSTSSFVGWGWTFDRCKVVDIEKIKQALIDRAQKLCDQYPDNAWYQNRLKDYKNFNTNINVGDIELGPYYNEETETEMELAEHLGISVQYIPDGWGMGGGGFIVTPGMDETPRQVCNELKEQLEKAGIEVDGEPEYYEEAYND